MENISGSQTSASALSNSALRGTLPLFGETQANSPSLSSSICERLVWHFCPREGCETLNLHPNSHLIFLRVRSNVEILNRRRTTSTIPTAVLPSQQAAWTEKHFFSSTFIRTTPAHPVVTARPRTILVIFHLCKSLTFIIYYSF